MLKKILSAILCFSLIFTISAPAFAVENYETEVGEQMSFNTSETGRLEMEFSGEKAYSGKPTAGGTPFQIRQFESDELIQVVSGETQGSTLLVTNYQNGEPTTQETILISDRVTKIADDQTERQPRAKTSIGYITYKNNIYTNISERVQAYSDFQYSDNEAYTINGKATDTSNYRGVARQVITLNSSAYNEWFYDGHTPSNRKDNALAYWFWTDLFDANQYPGVSKYA